MSSRKTKEQQQQQQPVEKTIKQRLEEASIQFTSPLILALSLARLGILWTLSELGRLLPGMFVS